MMDNDGIDFTGLNPANDSQRFEQAIGRISAAASPILARRRLKRSVWWQLTVWRKPVFAVGVAVILLMFGVAQYEGLPAEEEPVADHLALALGVPTVMSEWVSNETPPRAEQILYPGEDE